MRILQSLILKIFSLGALVGGIALLLKPVSELYALAIRAMPDVWWVKAVVCCAAIILGLVGIIPLSLRRRPRLISFPEPAGNLNIHVDAIETALNRSLAKRPDVKRMVVHVIREPEPGKVRVKADCIPYKRDDISARNLLADLQDAIRKGVLDMLGEDVVTSVEVNARGIVPRATRQPKEPKAKRGKTEAAQELAATETDYREEFQFAEVTEPDEPEDADERQPADDGYLYVQAEEEVEQTLPESDRDEDPHSGTAFLDLEDEDGKKHDM